MQKLVFGLLLLLASSRIEAADLCMSVTSNPDNRSFNRDEQLIVEPLPVYPRRPQAERGYVDVEFKITTEGTVRDPIVLISIPPGLFDEAALDTVLMFRYKPRIVDGRPVVVEGVQKRISFIPSGQDEPQQSKPAISKEVYDRITEAQELVDAKDYSGALRLLNNLYNPDKLTEYEQVNVLNYQGFVYYNMDDIPNAMRAYERQLLIPSLEPQTAKLTTYTLAQLNMMEERYGRALELLNKWFMLETNPAPEPFILYAQNLYQVKRYRDMIKPIETAIRIAEKHKKPVKEDWYRLLRYANSAIEEFQNAVDISKEMNKRWPSEENSYEIAMSWLRLGDRNEAHAALRELLASWPETDYVTPLHLAAADGDTTFIADLLTNGADVNLQTRDDSTPLYWAGKFGQVEAVKMLIDAKADVNAKTTMELTALHQAAQDGYSSIVETLIAADADVNAVTKSEENSPLLLAVTSNHTSVVEMLISAGADVNAKTMKDFTALHLAAQEGFSLIVEMLIAAGADVNAVSNSNTPPLLVAVFGNQTPVVEMLISAGADVNAKQETNLTVLHLAAKRSEAAIVELLIAAGAHVNAKTESGRTPLHWAAEFGNASVVEILIAAGAEVDSRDEDEWTPLTWAAYLGNSSAVDILIAAGAEVDPKDKGDRTPLAWAAPWGDTAVATRLIDQGANVAGVEMMAELGAARAQALLGSLYAQGRGVQQDDSLALRWYRTAAELGNADAAYALGEMYLDGRVIRTSAKKAAQWFQAAAHNGHRGAQVKLSELYLKGVGVRKNPTEASMWSCFAGA